MKSGGGIAAVLFLWIGWIMFGQPDNSVDDSLKVAFPSQERVDAYDPARIYYSHEYIFLESIYSPLVELSDEKGSPISSIAKEFYWKGNDLHLVIREDLTTIDGHTITVDDVIFSLKRLIVLSHNTHGDFKNLICPDTELSGVEEDCPRIAKEGNTLVLKMDAPWDFLIPMLAAIDFAIIPRGSVDPQTLKIVDYRNTSGPYYVEKDEGEGNIVLRANSRHFHFRENMAEKISFVPTRGINREEVIRFFNQGEVDHVATIHGFSIEDIKKIDQENNISIHETIHIRKEVAYITDRGKQRISLDKRRAFSKILQRSFHEHYADREGHRITKQFFLPMGEGGFSNEDKIFLEKLMEKMQEHSLNDDIFLGIHKSNTSGLEADIKIAKTYMPNLKAEQAKGIPAFVKLEKQDIPDYIMVKTDTGFLEDISLLSYSMNAGLFGFSKEEGRAWLKDYMQTVDKKERIKKLKEMHLQSLSQGWMIPLFSTPYVAITRKPWEPQLSELFANNPLWKIRRK